MVPVVSGNPNQVCVHPKRCQVGGNVTRTAELLQQLLRLVGPCSWLFRIDRLTLIRVAVLEEIEHDITDEEPSYFRRLSVAFCAVGLIVCILPMFSVIVAGMAAISLSIA